MFALDLKGCFAVLAKTFNLGYRYEAYRQNERHCEPRQRRGNLLTLALDLKDCFAVLAMTALQARHSERMRSNLLSGARVHVERPVVDAPCDDKDASRLQFRRTTPIFVF